MELCGICVAESRFIGGIHGHAIRIDPGVNGDPGGSGFFEKIGKAVEISVGRLPLRTADVFGIRENFGRVEGIRGRAHLKKDGV